MKTPIQYVVHYEATKRQASKIEEYVASLDSRFTALNDSSCYFECEIDLQTILDAIVKIGSKSFYVHQILRGDGSGDTRLEYKRRLLAIQKLKAAKKK